MKFNYRGGLLLVCFILMFTSLFFVNDAKAVGDKSKINKVMKDFTSGDESRILSNEINYIKSGNTIIKNNPKFKHQELIYEHIRSFIKYYKYTRCHEYLTTDCKYKILEVMKLVNPRDKNDLTYKIYIELLYDNVTTAPYSAIPRYTNRKVSRAVAILNLDKNYLYNISDDLELLNDEIKLFPAAQLDVSDISYKYDVINYKYNWLHSLILDMDISGGTFSDLSRNAYQLDISAESNGNFYHIANYSEFGANRNMIINEEGYYFVSDQKGNHYSATIALSNNSREIKRFQWPNDIKPPFKLKLTFSDFSEPKKQVVKYLNISQ